MMTAIRWAYSKRKGAASRMSTGVVGFERKRPEAGIEISGRAAPAARVV